MYIHVFNSFKIKFACIALKVQQYKADKLIVVDTDCGFEIFLPFEYQPKFMTGDG